MSVRYLLSACGRLAPLALAGLLAACASTPPPREAYREPYREPPRAAWRPSVDRETGIAQESIGNYDTHMGAEIASARYASVGGAVLDAVYEGGRRQWRVQVIGRIGESPQSLHRRIADNRPVYRVASNARSSTGHAIGRHRHRAHTGHAVGRHRHRAHAT